MAPPRTGHVDGLATYHYDADGPPIVIVHGTMDRAAGVRRTARALEGYDVVAFDRRGYAGSRDAGLSPHMADQVADLVAVIELLDRGAATIFGHSLGALVALHTAVVRPDLVAAVGAWEPPLPWFEWYGDSAGTRARDLARSEDPAAAAESFMRMMIGDRIWDRLPRATQDERRAEGQALVADLTLCRRPDARLDPSLVEVPVLVGFGSESPERFRRSAATLMGALPDPMSLEVADASHGVHLSHPTELATFARAAAARARS